MELELHDWDVDFAVWCTYKYLNSGPGATGGCFVHEKHVTNKKINRLAGWWGQNKDTRFKMETEFDPIPTAESWQVSNAPILSMAAIRASLDVYTRAGGMKPLREKSIKLFTYMDFLIKEHIADKVENITPLIHEERGCQFSLKILSDEGKKVFEALEANGVACDWRYPNVIRVAAVPLYNSFEDCYKFVTLLEKLLNE